MRNHNTLTLSGRVEINYKYQVEMAVQPPLAQTDSIGDYLQQEYGSKPPNTHIGYFYIRLGQEICHYPNIQQEAIATLNRIL